MATVVFCNPALSEEVQGKLSCQYFFPVVWKSVFQNPDLGVWLHASSWLISSSMAEVEDEVKNKM